MEKNIDHDKEGKLLRILEEKSCGLMSIDRIYRTIHYNVRYVISYKQDPYVEITLRYKNSGMDLLKNLGANFSKKSCNEPLFYIDGNYYYWEDVLEIQKENPNKQIIKVILNTYEQLEYLLSNDETL